MEIRKIRKIINGILLEKQSDHFSSLKANFSDPRVHYERTPDGRVKATMAIKLHIQRSEALVEEGKAIGK